MAEVDEFLAETLPRQIEAEKALHSGDVTPRLKRRFSPAHRGGAGVAPRASEGRG
jgi:hypothetical protein